MNKCTCLIAAKYRFLLMSHWKGHSVCIFHFIVPVRYNSRFKTDICTFSLPTLATYISFILLFIRKSVNFSNFLNLNKYKYFSESSLNLKSSYIFLYLFIFLVWLLVEVFRVLFCPSQCNPGELYFKNNTNMSAGSSWAIFLWITASHILKGLNIYQ